MSRLLGILAIFLHPVVLEVLWIAYWSRWALGWTVAAGFLLVGMSALLYIWLLQEKRDIALVLGSERRFLLLWHLLAVSGLWSAASDPLLYTWLSFFLWMSVWGLLLHWRWEYSFHVYGWAGMAGFYAGYFLYYPWHTVFFLLMSGGIGYLRWYQEAHSLFEVWRGGLLGFLGGVGYVIFHTLMP